MTAKKVTIIGAGPVGLLAAATLAKNGITVRIFDKKPAIENLSKAVAIHAGTLECLEASHPKLLQKFLANLSDFGVTVERENELVKLQEIDEQIVATIKNNNGKFAIAADYLLDCVRIGRVFLVGDAAHIHSPVGGQERLVTMASQVGPAHREIERFSS